MTTSENSTRWDRLSLDGDPHIILGKRAGKGMQAVRLAVHRDFFPELRYVCECAIIKIAETQPRPYEPTADLIGNEQHFTLSSSDVAGMPNSVVAKPDAVRSTSALDTEKQSALLALLENPVDNQRVTQEEYQSLGPFFYAICFQQSDLTWVSFVRKTNPRQFFKMGRIWCQYSSTLNKLDTQPTFALDPSIDVVIHNGDIISFSAAALNFLFTDVRLVQSGIPGQVDQLRETLSSTIPLSDASVQALNASGRKLKSVASRIYALSTRLAELQEIDSLTPERYSEIAAESPEALALLKEDGILDFDEDGALIFLDLIEGRYFEDDWTGSPRRADKFSRR